MRPRKIEVAVAGIPVPKGSRTSGHRLDGSAYTRAASPREGPWLETVAREAQVARGGAGPLDPPYAVGMTFAMPRPTRAAHGHPTRGDLDKLVRAVLDGLTRGGLIVDDRHVVELIAAKRWADGETDVGVAVTVGEALGGPGSYNVSAVPVPDRIAMCAAPHGEHDYWALEPGEVPGACLHGECPCEPVVFEAGLIGRRVQHSDVPTLRGTVLAIDRVCVRWDETSVMRAQRWPFNTDRPVNVYALSQLVPAPAEGPVTDPAALDQEEGERP